MENEPFEDVFHIENGDFPLLCLITGGYPLMQSWFNNIISCLQTYRSVYLTCREATFLGELNNSKVKDIHSDLFTIKSIAIAIPQWLTPVHPSPSSYLVSHWDDLDEWTNISTHAPFSEKGPSLARFYSWYQHFATLQETKNVASENHSWNEQKQIPPKPPFFCAIYQTKQWTITRKSLKNDHKDIARLAYAV